MLQLLIISDDFTGALDTGIQFRGKHTALRFGQAPDSYLNGLGPDTQVLVVDAETRHLAPDKAAAIVGQIVADAVAVGVECIYKKTDSGLRGNIGAELAAALEQSGEQILHFVPALPQLNRITKNGIHYIDGQEVADSVFGRDPFEPVCDSKVADIIARQSDVKVTTISDGGIPSAGIAVYDAETQADLECIAQSLYAREQTKLLAGCAGFANALHQIIQRKIEDDPPPELPWKLVTICGSINPITIKQMDMAEQANVPRVRLTNRQKLNDGWMFTPDWYQDVEEMEQLFKDHTNVIVECDGLGDPEGLAACRKKLSMDLDQMRRTISQTMGSLLKKFLEDGAKATWMVTGGDTLMAFMELAGLHEMTPICEYVPGVVLTSVHFKGDTVYLLTKSGGFGEDTLLLDLEKKLKRQS